MQSSVSRLKRWLARKAPVRAVVRCVFPQGQRIRVEGGPLAGMTLVAPPMSGVTDYKRGEYEALEAEILRGLMNATSEGAFYDCGAHIGYHSLVVGTVRGAGQPIYAFEPNPVSHALLVRNLAQLGGCQGAEAHQAAISDTSGTMLFSTGTPGGVASGLTCFHPDHYTHTGPEFEVTTVSLDDAVFEWQLQCPGVIKLDVEGAEARALAGARRVCEQFHPAWLIEVHSRERMAEVLCTLSAYGYDVFVETAPTLLPFVIAVWVSKSQGLAVQFEDWLERGLLERPDAGRVVDAGAYAAVANDHAQHPAPG